MITKIDDSSFSVSEPVTILVSDIQNKIALLQARQVQIDQNHDEEKRQAHDSIQAEIDSFKNQLQQASDAGVAEATTVLNPIQIIVPV